MYPTREETRRKLIAQADRAHAAYPQYAGHFDSYVLVTVARDVKTKMGVAFRKNELAIARPGTHTSGPLRTAYRTVYSVSNGCDTSVRADHTTEVK